MELTGTRLKINMDFLRLYAEMLLLFRFLEENGIAKYAVFFVYIAWKAFRKELKLNVKYWTIGLPALFCFVWGLISAVFHVFNMETLKEGLFIILPVTGACIILNSSDAERRNRYIDAMYWAIVTLFLKRGIPSITPKSLMESTYAFIFGIYLLYYLYDGEKLKALLTLIFFVLAHKRIAVGGVVLAAAVMAVLYLKDRMSPVGYKNALKLVRLAGIFSVLALLFYVFLCKYDIITLIMRKFSINSMGRIQTWRKMESLYEFSLLHSGKGFGGVKNELNLLNDPWYSRLHNDILVYYIELGFLGFCIYFYLHFQVIVLLIRRRLVNYRSAVLILAFVIYTFVCYCTDNISIYIVYLFPFYMILGNVIFKDEIDCGEKLPTAVNVYLSAGKAVDFQR